MQELFEQLRSFARGLWLKKHFIVLISWIICPIGWYQVNQLPDQYKASARVYVDTQSLLKPLLRGLTINTNPQEQVELMVRTLLSRPNLEKIVRMTDMDVQAITQADTDEIIDNLKNKINISTTSRRNLYTISYEGTSPELATEVVKAALAVFMDNTLGQSRNDSKTAKRFLEQQITDYEKRLGQNDAQITEFKRKNGDLLVGHSGGFYSTLSAHQGRLDEARLMLQEKEMQLASAQAQLAGEEPSFGLYDPGTGKTQFASQYDARIDALRENLDQLTLRFTEEYPDVKEIKHRISQLQTLKDDELEAYKKLPALARPTSSNSNLNANMVYQELKLSVSSLTNDVAALKVRVNNFQDKVDELQQKIHLIPQVEAELAALQRGYQATKSKYDELRKRSETALLAQRAEQSVEDIQFKIIDPPRAGDEPTGPFRIIFYTAITVVGLGMGTAVAFILSQITPVAITAYQLTQLTGIPVLGSVSMTGNNNNTRSNKRNNVLFYTLIATLLGCYVLIIGVEAAPQLLPSMLDAIRGLMR